MSFYERRLQTDIDQIRAEVVSIGLAAERGVARSIRALLTNDDAEAYEVALDDLPINRRVRALDKRCHAFVARHLPSAGPLRFISSVLRLNIELERVGDYAVSIARQAARLSSALPPEVSQLIVSMDAQARDMLRNALQAFADQDAALARRTKSQASSLDAGLSVAYQVLATLGEGDDPTPVRDLFRLLTVFARLERVSDQAKNICEEAMFAATGETKPPKVYKVLFLDQDHRCWGPLAEAMARKAYPGSGAYDSAGLTPAAASAPELASIAAPLSLDLTDAVPQGLASLDRELADYHVIVALGPVQDLPSIPFSTALLRWPMPADAAAAVPALSAGIASLMERLRGKDAP